MTVHKLYNNESTLHRRKIPRQTVLVFGLKLDGCLVKFVVRCEGVQDFLTERILSVLPFEGFFLQIELLDLKKITTL